MAVNLAKKGQKIDLTKGNPGLKQVLIGLGWDVNAFDTGSDFDLDGSAFMLDNNGTCTSSDAFIFYNNPTHSTGCIEYMGYNRTGSGEGDDEQIIVDLTAVPENISKIAFTVTIFDAEMRNQTFGQVSNAFIRVCDNTTGEELIRYDLGEEFSIETAVVVAELYRSGNEWKFNAIGNGFQGGLAALCNYFGLSVA